MTTGTKQSTTGQVWTAGYGTCTPGTNVITDYRRLTEWRSWPDALNDMMTWVRDYAANKDEELRAEQLAGRKTDLKADMVEIVEEYLRTHVAEVDTEVHMECYASVNGEHVLFVVERDASEIR